jgi:hypothetical protein
MAEHTSLTDSDNGSDTPSNTGPSKKILKYPEDIGKSGQTYIRFHIVSRLDLSEQKTIYLYAPPGLSVTDGVGYHQLDMGTIGGLVERFDQNRTSGQGVVDAAMNIGTKADLTTLAKLATGDIGKGFGQRALMKQGIAQNPFSVQQFSGVMARAFTFAFKLVAESKDQAKTLKAIENTFRKYLYPSAGDSDLALRYPPYWKIEFYRNGDYNEHLPFINLSYLHSMTATYNQSTNAFHKDGRPLEVDISLQFTESKNMTREDLYKKNDHPETGPEYTNKHVGSVTQADVEAEIAAATAAATKARAGE